jgi:membrane-bound metal-dependent hydrolase YbcI (DUF457 family)
VNTPSHFLITLAIKKRREQQGKPVHGAAFLLGSVLPDVSLILLTIGYILYRRWFAPIDEFIFGPSYDLLYFTNPWWIVGHNLLHAPFNILAMGALGWWGMHTGRRWGSWLFWFALGCGLHSLIDIFTHYDDGPLLLFPFNWQLRFNSPVSYWDSNHYGNIFGPLEMLLNLAIITWLLLLWWRQRQPRHFTPTP